MERHVCLLYSIIIIIIQASWQRYTSGVAYYSTDYTQNSTPSLYTYVFTLVRVWVVDKLRVENEQCSFFTKFCKAQFAIAGSF